MSDPGVTVRQANIEYDCPNGVDGFLTNTAYISWDAFCQGPAWAANLDDPKDIRAICCFECPYCREMHEIVLPHNN